MFSIPMLQRVIPIRSEVLNQGYSPSLWSSSGFIIYGKPYCKKIPKWQHKCRCSTYTAGCNLFIVGQTGIFISSQSQIFLNGLQVSSQLVSAQQTG